MTTTIYLDESGCLGWKLDAPLGRGGSSQFFTIAAAIIPDDMRVGNALPRAVTLPGMLTAAPGAPEWFKANRQ